MRYTLTGNFQYDLGIFGLKKVLDFFNEPFLTNTIALTVMTEKTKEIKRM